MRATLSGWGRHPVASMHALRPERMDGVRAVVGQQPSILARGLGRSYGDAALNSRGGVLLTERLDRFLEFSPDTGVLECEAGVTMADVLRHFLPRGFFPPVVPGTKHVTLGGALACDVHGKNHHRAGSIGRHVLDFRLLLADGSEIRCSREENPEVFRATIGGMGLTGIITQLRLQLRRVGSAYVKVDYDRAPTLDHALELFHDSDGQYEYSVAWIDSLARGRALGRGVLMRGNPMAVGELRGTAAEKPLELRHRSGVAVPFEIPGSPVNALTMRAFNQLYYRRHAKRAHGVQVDADSFFFPLDRVRNWNRLYGRKGLLQYQCVLPFDAGRDGLARVLRELGDSRLGSFLSVLKAFGPGEEGQLLSFPSAGYTLALDMPARGAAVFSLLDRLDTMVADYGGRVYLAKDARLSASMFRRMYPQYECWRGIKRRIDPTNRFASDLSLRLGLEP